MEKEDWFVTFRAACRMVGVGMGLVEEDAADGEFEEEEDVEGEDVGARKEEQGPLKWAGVAREARNLFAVVELDEERKEWVDEKEDLDEMWPAFKDLC